MTFVAGQKLTAAELNNAGAPVGTIQMWATATPPTGWLICNGGAVSAVTYPALFALIGGTLPDMQQRFPIGKAAAGTGSTLLGTGGNIDHTHTTGSHAHGVLAGITGNNSALIQVQSGTGQNVAANNHTHTYGVGNTDTNTGIVTDGKNPPFVSVHFIIRAG